MNADPDRDGQNNLMEFAFGLYTFQSDAASLPRLQRNATDVFFAFPTPPGVGGIVYGAEWTTDLATGPWTPIPDTGTNGDHLFTLPISPNPKVFLRLRVSEQ